MSCLSVHAGEPKLLILGDSLSAGYGIDPAQGWVQQLQSRLQSHGYPQRVINASISGETTRGARERIAALLTEHQPQMLIVELGGNDGLRGISLEEMQQNLHEIILHARKREAQVLLVTMKLPPNYGSVYTDKFEAVFTSLTEQHDISLTPFILEHIAEHAELMQADGIHPLQSAHTQMLDNLWPSIEQCLSEQQLNSRGREKS